MGLKEWGTLLMLSFLWGGSFLFIEISVGQLPPLTVVFLRVGISAIILTIVLKASRIKVPISRKILISIFIMGLFNISIPFLLITWGQTQITSGLASIFNATMLIFTVIVTHFFTTDEKMDRHKLAGVVVGFSGVVFMIGVEELFTFGANILGQLAVLAAALFYASSTTFGRRFKTMGVPPMAIATGQMIVASLILAPLVIIFDKPWLLTVPDTNGLIAIFCLATFSTALAYFLYFKLLESSGATNLALVTFLIPPIAIFLGWSILGETLNRDQIIGMGFIIFGLSLIDGRLFKTASKKHR
ncbi:DMT family transporter [Lentilitoribacter sp. Alg239-R112]|uniref:DMT family transporter n=1 Tax=Lentilitoribacter sp. Alg239-R112 TaxID=2305987 RepID=UPI0018D8535D|nr:DMT family transporter [Lentilitoribacter sp. Alg239-R112]